jgi:hypothetical protein
MILVSQPLAVVPSLAPPYFISSMYRTRSKCIKSSAHPCRHRWYHLLRSRPHTVSRAMDEGASLYDPTSRGPTYGNSPLENIASHLIIGTGTTLASGAGTVPHQAQYLFHEGRTNPCFLHSLVYTHAPQINEEASPLVGCGVYPPY